MPDSPLEPQKERKQRILAIDDDPEVLELITATLQDAGYEVMTSETAEMALNLMNDEGLPHLAVIDIRLPGLDGLSLSQRIHDISDVPVTMLTVVDDDEIVSALRAHGCLVTELGSGTDLIAYLGQCAVTRGK